MDPHLFLAYCLAVSILIVMPGPVVTLVVANSLSHGSRAGLATVVGASAGNAILLVAAAVGLVAFFALLNDVFEVVRWAGAFYLIWLGIKAWRGHGAQAAHSALTATRSARAVFLQVFVIGITNPKAMIFYIAFLPQFIDPHQPAGPQLAMMIGASIVIGLLSDIAYALLAGRARGWFTSARRRRLQGRITGSLLIGVGCGLLIARRAN